MFNSHGYYSVSVDAGAKPNLQGHLDPGYINMPLYTTGGLTLGEHTIIMTNEWDYNGTSGGPYGEFPSLTLALTHDISAGLGLRVVQYRIWRRRGGTSKAGASPYHLWRHDCCSSGDYE